MRKASFKKMNISRSVPLPIKLALLTLLILTLSACDDGQKEKTQAQAPSPAEVKTVGTSPYTDCSFDAAASSETFDIAIINGRVMDPECNFDGVRNVGIKGNRITLITAGDIKGNKTIDATGLVVAPGFINTHTHSFAPFDQKIVAHDGATTILDTEYGGIDVGSFYAKYEGNSFMNYGIGVAHEAARRHVMDGTPLDISSDPSYAYDARAHAQQDGHASWALDIPTREQHADILRVIDQGMRDGGLAVSSTVGYMGYGVPTYEMFDLQKLAKKYERFFGSHTRFGPTEKLPLNYSLGAREIIANAVALDGAVILSHINNQNWQEIYELSARLQERGMNIFSEYYPSITGNPNLAAPGLMPDKIKGNNIDPTKHIYNPDTGELFESAEAFFKMQKEQPSRPTFLILRPATWLKEWPHMKNIAIANDSITYFDKDGKTLPFEADFSAYGGHPRNASTYGLVYREAREQGIPLMDIVNNTSYIPAKYFSRVGLKAMQERGRLQPGMIADITMFNPDTITETATMAEGKHGSSTKGIHYVMINGQLAIENGVANTKIRPGQPIRYEVLPAGELKLEDLADKKYQWHSDLSGYPPTRFPPQKMNPPSPYERKNRKHHSSNTK